MSPVRTKRAGEQWIEKEPAQLASSHTRRPGAAQPATSAKSSTATSASDRCRASAGRPEDQEPQIASGIVEEGHPADIFWRLQVLDIASVSQRSDLLACLAEDVALGDQPFVGVPPDRLRNGAVRPSGEQSSGAACAERQLFDRD